MSLTLALIDYPIEDAPSVTPCSDHKPVTFAHLHERSEKIEHSTLGALDTLPADSEESRYEIGNLPPALHAPVPPKRLSSHSNETPLIRRLPHRSQKAPIPIGSRPVDRSFVAPKAAPLSERLEALTRLERQEIDTSHRSQETPTPQASRSRSLFRPMKNVARRLRSRRYQKT